MYVCICNAVTERRIRSLVHAGHHTLNEIQALTGCAGSCGSCREHAEAVIAGALTTRPTLPIVSPVETPWPRTA